MDAQSVSDKQDVAQLHLPAGLHPLHRRPVDSGVDGKSLLGHVLVEPSDADAVTDGPAGFADPLGLLVGHELNALPIMITCQQQFCGII